MPQPSSRLPLLLGGLVLLVIAGAAGLLLLQEDAPIADQPTVVSSPNTAPELPVRDDIDAFVAPPDGPEVAPPSTARKLGALTGQLLDANRRPVTSGRIELLEGIPLGLGGLSQLPRLGPRAVVDSDGRFTVPDVPASDQVVVRALGEGFETTESGPHLVLAGETSDIGAVLVDPGLTVHGTISDPRGRGISGAQVAITRGPPLALGRDGAPPERVVLTDERGSYTIAHASRGPFTLLVSAEGYGNGVETRGVQLDQSRQIEINVHLPPALTLAGVVWLPGGEQPAIHAEVLARGGELGLGDSLMRTDGEGRFRFTDLARGRHVLMLDPEGYLPVSHEVLPGSDREDITIELLKASGLGGVVTDEDNRPLKAFDLQLRRSDKQGNIGETVGAVLRVRDNDGRFEVGDLVPGFYLLEVWAREHSVTISAPARVLKGGKVTMVNVAMQLASTLHGLVVDDLGRPVAGAKISLHGNNTPTFGFLRASAARGSWHTATRSEGDGTFEFTNVTARTYQVEVDHPGYPLVHRNDIEIIQGGDIALETIVLDRPATLQGVVTDSAGTVLKGITVTLGGGVNRATRQGVSNGQGRYRFERLAPGDYQVHAYTPRASPISVLVSNIHRIQRDADGKPMIPVDVSLLAGEEREYRVIAQD